MNKVKLMIELDEDRYNYIQEQGYVPILYDDMIATAILEGTPLEEIPNPCIECSQNCCVWEYNGEKCEYQKVYVVKENQE